MKNFNEMPIAERKEIAELFSNWLKPYTREVIVKVMSRTEEIINNDFTMSLLRELKSREDREVKYFTDAIEFLISDFDGCKEYDPHNNALTHASSYRDVLYDMYIK